MAHETDERLFRAFSTVRQGEEDQVTRHLGTNIWHNVLGHCSDKILKASFERVHGINKKDVRGHEKIHCDMCAPGKLGQASWKTVALEGQCAANHWIGYIRT